MFELLAQVPTPEVGVVQIVQLVSSLGSVGLVLGIGYYFQTKADAAAEKCKSEREANTTAFLAQLEKKDIESKEFLEHLTDKCHEVHKESLNTLRETNRTLARATYVQEVIAARLKLSTIQEPPTITDSQIVKQNDRFEREHP